MQDDPRYDAVGSSSLREELFSTFLKAQSANTTPPAESKATPNSSKADDHEAEQEKEKKKREKKERAVKEREEKIKAEQRRVVADINKSRMGLNKEEGELEFRCAGIPNDIRRLQILRRAHSGFYPPHLFPPLFVERC